MVKFPGHLLNNRGDACRPPEQVFRATDEVFYEGLDLLHVTFIKATHGQWCRRT